VVVLAGKLVEEEEGSFAVWLSYLFTGVGANLVSWLILPRTVVSVGASGAVFGLFAISVLVKVLSELLHSNLSIFFSVVSQFGRGWLFIQEIWLWLTERLI
jgi:membrane associated rhomboid family serine protease